MATEQKEKSMTQEDKELLLRDLCARLPYGVKGECKFEAPYSFDMIFRYHFFDAELVGIKNDGLHVRPLIEHFVGREFANKEVADGIDINNFKPYLRPMSSMTEEEQQFIEDKFATKIDSGNGCYIETHTSSESGVSEVYMEDVCELIRYLNSRHFDYQRIYDEKYRKWKSMIEMGLAMPAPDGMYNF